MANHPSAEKRNRQREKRTLRNRSIKAAVRTQVKTVRTAIAVEGSRGRGKGADRSERGHREGGQQGRAAQEDRLAQGSRLAHAVHQIAKA